jgi:ribosomal-protein-alanine N-acetyltransferase
MELVEALRRGSRVVIRSPRQEDEHEVTALVRNSRRLHNGWVAPASNAQEYTAYLRRNEGDAFEALLLIRREDLAVLGAVNLSQIVRGGFQNAYLDYWIGAPYARQGYMGEGLALALDHAFGALRLHRLEANIQPGTTASSRLVASLGFRLEGFSPRYLKIRSRWRDHERWTLLHEEWSALRPAALTHRGDPALLVAR